MAVLSIKFVFLFAISTYSIIQKLNCDEIQWTGSAVVFGTPELYTQQAQHHHEIKALLESQAETLTRMADTQTQTAETQAQMANALGQLVALLQNMTTTMNTVVSVMENQQKTLENISRSLPVVLEQQANQTELLSQCQPRPKSNCSDVESNNRFQTTQATMITTNPTMMTSTERITQDTTTLRSVEWPIRDCSDLVRPTNGHYPSGIYTITPTNDSSFDVFCDMNTADGGWTVFQKRFNGSIDFYRGWDEYEQGFGHLNGEFWLGLRKMHQLTQSGSWVMRVDLADFEGNSAYALYNSFHIGDAASNYRLSIGIYSGTAGDSMGGNRMNLNNMKFSTYDRENDGHFNTHCADFNQGAWWYRGCTLSNLNGLYFADPFRGVQTGMVWYDWKNWQSLKKSEMKIRRAQ